MNLSDLRDIVLYWKPGIKSPLARIILAVIWAILLSFCMIFPQYSNSRYVEFSVISATLIILWIIIVKADFDMLFISVASICFGVFTSDFMFTTGQLDSEQALIMAPNYSFYLIISLLMLKFIRYNVRRSGFDVNKYIEERKAKRNKKE